MEKKNGNYCSYKGCVYYRDATASAFPGAPSDCDRFGDRTANKNKRLKGLRVFGLGF